MDYSHNYFAGAQPYQFVGIAPLTPSHSDSVASDEFNTTSPPEVFNQFPHGLPHEHQYQSYDNFTPQFSTQAFPSPPTPPNQHASQQQQQQQAAQVQAQAQAQLQAAQAIPLPDSLLGTKEETDDQARRQGSNSDDEDLTPAQSRRKAQNRAAQRAFRERKERHVKDLEAKLATLEATNQDTSMENERLKQDLQKMSTENKILRATSSIQQQQANGANGGGGHGGPNGHSHTVALPTTTGPMSYNPTDFYSDLLANHANKTPSHRIVTSKDGERLLAAGATWEYIISHDMYKKGLVDVGDVSLRLKHRAKCDGQGPVFEERAIIDAIEQSVASGSDELI